MCIEVVTDITTQFQVWIIKNSSCRAWLMAKTARFRRLSHLRVWDVQALGSLWPLLNAADIRHKLPANRYYRQTLTASGPTMDTRCQPADIKDIRYLSADIIDLSYQPEDIRDRSYQSADIIDIRY